MTRPRVLLADDHRIVVAGLEALLAADYELVGRAQDGRSLLEMARQARADFIVADISMPGSTASTRCARCGARGSTCR